MGTRNFDSQLITQRLQDKVNASFVSVAQQTQTQIQQPMQSVPTNVFVNQVVSGGMTTYAKSEGVMLRDTGCNCTPAPTTNGLVELNIGGRA